MDWNFCSKTDALKTEHSLLRLSAQEFVLHQQPFSLQERFAHAVAAKVRLDLAGGDLLNAGDGQRALLHEELRHLLELAHQGVIEWRVPEKHVIIK